MGSPVKDVLSALSPSSALEAMVGMPLSGCLSSLAKVRVHYALGCL